MNNIISNVDVFDGVKIVNFVVKDDEVVLFSDEDTYTIRSLEGGVESVKCELTGGMSNLTNSRVNRGYLELHNDELDMTLTNTYILMLGTGAILIEFKTRLIDGMFCETFIEKKKNIGFKSVLMKKRRFMYA